MTELHVGARVRVKPPANRDDSCEADRYSGKTGVVTEQRFGGRYTPANAVVVLLDGWTVARWFRVDEVEAEPAETEARG